MMTHREGVLTALDHRVPDRVPLDIAGTFASTLNRHAYEALRAYLGLKARPTKLASRRSQTASVEEDVLTRLDVDCRQMVTGGPEHRPDRELPDGSYLDNWGVTG